MQLSAKVPHKNRQTQATEGNRWYMSVIYLKGSVFLGQNAGHLTGRFNGIWPGS